MLGLCSKRALADISNKPLSPNALNKKRKYERLQSLAVINKVVKELQKISASSGGILPHGTIMKLVRYHNSIGHTFITKSVLDYHLNIKKIKKKLKIYLYYQHLIFIH